MKYEIWSEGYRTNGDGLWGSGHKGTAHFYGTAEGETFEQACAQFFKDNPHLVKEYPHDTVHNSIWGCRLFNNEADARKSFG